jgi:hypothetical protein
MRFLKIAITAALLAGYAFPAGAGDYWYRHGNAPDIEIWTNKGYDATYYYGEDVAVYFRAERDCYVVVYDIDPSGAVTVLFPSNYYNSSFVTGDRVYRIPDYYSDYTLEVSGGSGTEHIFAVASYEYMEPPDFMRYIGYDYGEEAYYDDGYFVNYMSGDLDGFVRYVNGRITNGPCSVAHARFHVDSRYRHHRHYRYWDYDPYYVGSVWIGCSYPGAEIWIDGIYFGIAPVLVPYIYVGHHWVWAYYGGYPCYQQYFYITSYQRYYIDIRIDDHYKDYRYRRRSFGGWVPLEKKYRNEDGFKERARRARATKVRSRTLPSHVVRDFSERGIISKDAPLVKRIRDDSRSRDAARLDAKRQQRSEIQVGTVDKNRKRAAEEMPSVRDLRKRGSETGEARLLQPHKPELSVKSEARKEKYKSAEEKGKDRKPSYSREKRQDDRLREKSVGKQKPKSKKSKGSTFRKDAGSSRKSPTKSAVKTGKSRGSSGKSSSRKERR